MADVVIVVTPVEALIDTVQPVVPPPGTHPAEHGVAKSHVVTAVPQTDPPNVLTIRHSMKIIKTLLEQKFISMF